MTPRTAPILCFLIALSIAGCSGSTEAGCICDAFVPRDVGTGAIDAGTDAASTGIDAGTDAASTTSDAGSDAASTTSDTGTDAASSTDAATTDAGGSLVSCGGRGGATCGSTEYCDYAGSPSCGAADGTGVCRARPDTCAPTTDAVCGCDGVTYSSACEAARAGTDVSASGSCGGAATFACGPAIECMTDVEYCEVTMGGPFPGHTSYACTALPSSCTASGSTPPSCAFCFPSGPPGGTCSDGASGEITVTRLTP